MLRSPHGARRPASSKSVRTRRAPRPTYTSTKSEPVQHMKGTPHADATALARRVLPVLLGLGLGLGLGVGLGVGSRLGLG